MKHIKSITFVAIAGATLFAATAGAASSSNQVAGQLNITPKASTTPSVSQSIKIQTIGPNKDIDGWLSDSKLLFVKQNKDLWETDPVTKKKYNPNNIYVWDIGTGKETLLAPNNTGVGNVSVSPDQKYVFYSDSNGYNIMNVSTKKSVNIPNLTFKNATSGSWSDTTHFIYWTADGTINSIDVNGKTQTLLKTGQKNLGGGITIAGSTIFYNYSVGNNVTFISYNMQTKESTTFKNVDKILPSPNGSQVAMVKDRTLVLTDLKGNVKSTITKVEQDDLTYGQNGDLTHLAWSPDSSKLAYSICTMKDADDGTMIRTYYVYDVKTGKQSQVPMDKNDLATMMKWSPSGKKILYFTANAIIASLP